MVRDQKCGCCSIGFRRMQTARSEMTFLSCDRPIMGLLGDESEILRPSPVVLLY